MEKKIKLRDLTEEQYKKWFKENCIYMNCKTCPFCRTVCSLGNFCWVRNKDLYTDKFLDQEIEVPDLLTTEEKTYLENVLRPFKDKIIYIKKQTIGRNWAGINIKLESIISERLYDIISLPVFEKDKYYKNLEVNRQYTVEDLGLFEEKKYKITLTEFWNSKYKLAIHCDTEEKTNKLLKAFDKLGKKWRRGDSYLKYNFYETYKEKICYSNWNTYDDVGYYKEDNVIIYEFDEVDLEN